MRAFRTVWRSVVGVYNELFFVFGVCLLWWVTGGIFVGAAIFLGWSALQSSLAAWFVPLLAIPAGPATAALASVARQIARELRVDRSVYWDGFRTYWRQALAANAAAMVVLSLLILNVQFYAARASLPAQFFGIFWLYLAVLALGASIYLFPVLVGLERPSVWGALKTAAVLALANPLYSAVLVFLALVLTALCVVLALLLPLAWPALIALLGEHSLILFMQRAGKKTD